MIFDANLFDTNLGHAVRRLYSYAGLSAEFSRSDRVGKSAGGWGNGKLGWWIARRIHDLRPAAVSSSHASAPPASGRTRVMPYFFRSSAARAAEASFGQ